MDAFFSWIGVIQEKIFPWFPRRLRFFCYFLLLCISLVYFTKVTYSVWYSYDSVYRLLSNGNYPSLNLVLDFLIRDISSHLEKFNVEAATQFKLLLSEGVVAFFIGFGLQRAKLSRGWGLAFYMISMFCFLLACSVCYFSFNRIMIPSYEDDLIYFVNKKWAKENQQYSKLPLVVEFIIENENDLEGFKEIIINGDVLNIFISQQSIYALEQCKLLDDFLFFIKNQKEKTGIKIFADIEFQYKDISLLDQSALASSRSLPFIYKMAYDFAIKLKNNYYIDYILGPVLDRRISLSDQTIGRRSFGHDHRIVALSALAAILGFQDANVVCIPKHFPGYPQNTYRNDNTHIKLNMTRYIDHGLQMNAAPFSYVYSHPALDIGGLLTDFIIIPSISSYLPYSLYHTMSMTNSGVYVARERFSTITSDAVFITDDIMMLLYGAIDNPKRSITKNSRLSIEKLHGEIKNHILKNMQYFTNKKFDLDNVSDVVGLLSRSALLSGNSLVLIRSQNPSSVQRTVTSLYYLALEDSFWRRITDVNEKLISFYRKKIKNHNNYSLHDDVGNMSMPFLKLSSSSFIDYLKLSSLRDGGNFCYFSSCLGRDDIAPVFNIPQIINNTKAQQFNIYTASYGDGNKSKIAKSFAEHLRRTNYEYYIFVLSHDWQADSLNALVEFLNANNCTNKLILFVAEGPDYLSYLSRNFTFDILDLMHTANIYCIFSNSYSVYSILDLSIKRDDLSFGNFQKITNTTIDLPNYFHNNYSDSNFKTNKSFDKIINPLQFSSIITNYNIIMHLYPAYLILLLLSFLFFLAGLLCQYVKFK
ncbi:MAG: hypothetical protein LBU39_00505 [Desulfobulbaceae bacterium]|jgi:hypothetical protein|nr:hypothetical protein [Desulfobulbaceae bacterium]